MTEDWYWYQLSVYSWIFFPPVKPGTLWNPAEHSLWYNSTRNILNRHMYKVTLDLAPIVFHSFDAFMVGKFTRLECYNGWIEALQERQDRKTKKEGHPVCECNRNAWRSTQELTMNQLEIWGLGLAGTPRRATLWWVSGIDHLSERNRCDFLQTTGIRLTFASTGLHGGHKLCQYLLDEQHSRTHAIQKVSVVLDHNFLT